MPTLEPDQRGERVAIDLDQTTREEGRTAGDVGQNHWWGLRCIMEIPSRNNLRLAST